MNNMASFVLKKMWLIIVIGVITASGFVLNRNYFGEYTYKTGEIIEIRMIKIPTDEISIHDPFVYNSYMKAYPVIDTFLKKTLMKYEYTKFNGDWARKNDVQKYKWIQNHINIHQFGQGVYEIVFCLNTNESVDLNYAESIASFFLDDYIAYSTEEMKTIGMSGQIKELRNFSIRPSIVNVNKKNILLKNSLIGFVFGSIFGTIVVLLLFMKRK